MRRERVEIALIGASVVALGLSGVLAARDRVPAPEAAVFRWINGLPDVPYAVPWVVMQVGFLGIVVVAGALAMWGRRRQLAVLLIAGGAGAWLLAKGVKRLVHRGRPAEVLDHVTLRHASLSGDGWISGHAAVSAAVVTIAWPALGPRRRAAAVVVLVVMNVARVYVGEHLPLDMVGGALFGIVCGAVTLRCHHAVRRRQRQSEDLRLCRSRMARGTM